MITNGQLVSSYICQVWGSGCYELIDQIVAPDFVFSLSSSGKKKDKYWYSRFVKTIRSAFVNITIEILNVVEQDDTVAIHYLICGDQVAAIMGVAPMGGVVKLDVMGFYEVERGMIKACETVTEFSSLKKQLQTTRVAR